MYESENSKSVNDFNDKTIDIIDYLSDENNFKNIPKELLAEGKSVIDNNPQIANGQLYVIEPNQTAFLVRVERMSNVEERELTKDEYKIAGIEKC